MRRITTTAVLGLLLAGSPGQAWSQVDLSLTTEIRDGTRIPTDQLAEFLGTRISIGADGTRIPPIALRVQLVAQRGGVLATWQSDARRLDPERAYPVWPRWLGPGANDAVAGPLKPAEFVIFRIYQKTTPEELFSGQCRAVTHVLYLAAVTAAGRPVGRDGALGLCLDIDR